MTELATPRRYAGGVVRNRYAKCAFAALRTVVP